MLGLDACELGAQLLELLRLALCARGEWPGREAATYAGGSKRAVRLGGQSPRQLWGLVGTSWRDYWPGVGLQFTQTLLEKGARRKGVCPARRLRPLPLVGLGLLPVRGNPEVGGQEAASQ